MRAAFSNVRALKECLIVSSIGFVSLCRFEGHFQGVPYERGSGTVSHHKVAWRILWTPSTPALPTPTQAIIPQALRLSCRPGHLDWKKPKFPRISAIPKFLDPKSTSFLDAEPTTNRHLSLLSTQYLRLMMLKTYHSIRSTMILIVLPPGQAKASCDKKHLWCHRTWARYDSSALNPLL